MRHERLGRHVVHLLVGPHRDDMPHAGLDEGVGGGLAVARRHEDELHGRLRVVLPLPRRHHLMQRLHVHRVHVAAVALEGEAAAGHAVTAVVQRAAAHRHHAQQLLGGGVADEQTQRAVGGREGAEQQVALGVEVEVRDGGGRGEGGGAAHQGPAVQVGEVVGEGGGRRRGRRRSSGHGRCDGSGQLRMRVGRRWLVCREGQLRELLYAGC